MGPEITINLPEKAEKELDESTTKAFNEIKKKDFEPFLLYGSSQLALATSRFSGGLEHNSTIQWEKPEKDYTAVLVATNPKYVFDFLRGTDIVEEIAKMVPRKNKDTRIGGVEIYDYDGRPIYSQGEI